MMSTNVFLPVLPPLPLSSPVLTVAVNNAVADKADVAKQLVVVNLAVGETFLLVVPRAQERLLALGAHEVLQVHEYKLVRLHGNTSTRHVKYEVYKCVRVHCGAFR